MGSIQTSIQLNDLFSGVMNNIVSSIDIAVASMQNMQQVMNADINTSSFENARNEINQAANAVNELNDAMNTSATPQASTQIMPPVVDSAEQVVNVDVVPVLPDPLVENPEPIRPDIEPNAPPEPVEVPVEWETDGLEVFTGTGIERFQQEVSSADSMLSTLNTTQARISQTAQGMDILPDAAVQDMNTMQQRLSTIQQRIQQIENNPVNIGTDTANAELEQLRGQLNQAVQAQNELNHAMQNMDVSGANNAYLRLSQTVSGTERYIRDNVDEQGRFNQQISDGAGQANQLTDTIKRAVAAYVSIQSVGKTLNISDELTQTTARLDLMNDSFNKINGTANKTPELVNMVYAAAQDARGLFNDMASVVARFGNNAKDAFGSSEEVVAFANLVQKQMTIAGASTQEAANAELQLSQALGSGVLRGDELNSVFEQAPNLIQNIADYLNVPIGKIREMAADGELSADVVKAAIFAASDDINAKFASMPMTWGQIWTSFQNTAMIASQPVLQRMNAIANSQAFQNFVNNAIGAMATLADMVLNLFDLIGSVAGFFADNWSVIAPIVYGIVAALIAYIAISAIGAAISGVMAMAEGVKAAAQMMATGATFAETAAQQGLNAALAACPITWIIVLIIALIAIIFAVCNAIAKMTGVAESGFGVICGGVFVVGATFKNLGLVIANVALGIWNALKACAANMCTAFHNSISNIKSFFYGLLSTALTVIGNICEALNRLPFISFDYSGITAMADDYAAKSSAAAGNKEDYTSVSDAFKQGFQTYDAFQSGWAKSAFESGAKWGDGVSNKVSGVFDGLFNQDGLPSSDYNSNVTPGNTSGAADGGEAGGNAAKTAANTGDTADNTAAIAKSLDITNEELKYLRDIAERDTVNRFTTASIKVEMTNHNRIDSKQDLDGIVSTLTSKIENAMLMSAEGVHV